jgi:hypothetical protein
MISSKQANAKPSFFCPNSFCSRKGFSQKPAFRHPMKNSNNPLAAEPESENDASRFIL